MTAVRLTCVMTLLLSLVLSASAQPKSADQIVGVWLLAKGTSVPKGATYEFTKGGKLVMSFEIDGKKQKLDFTYKLDKETIQLTSKVGDKEFKETLKIKKLTETELSVEDSKKQEAQFTKKK